MGDGGLVPGGPSTLFGPCTEDAQCPGVGAVCRTAAEDGYPGGYCTVPCQDRTPCEVRNQEFVTYHNCVALDPDDEQAYCERRCISGQECQRTPGQAYSCLGAALGPLLGGYCVPVCTSDADCGNGTFCNPFSGECQSEPYAAGSLGEAGSACSSDDQCASGQCVLEVDNPAFQGGYCLGYCILPAGYNTNNLFAGDVFPRGSCPDERAICFPANIGRAQENNLGFCLAECESNAECRDGYACQQQFQLRQGGEVFTFENGRCWPM